MRVGSAPRLIKRYENRKLYDTSAGRYVTIDALFDMVAAGQELHVVDRATGDDLTTTVLAQAVFEGVKQRSASVPRHVLSRLIQLAARPARALDLPRPADAAARGREEAERIVGALVQRGRLSLDDALALRQEIADSIHRISAEAQRSALDRVRALLDRHGRETGVQPAMDALKERLLTFEAYLEGSRRRPAAARRDGRTARRSAAARSSRTRR